MSSENSIVQPPKKPLVFAWYVSKEKPLWLLGALLAVITAESLSNVLTIELKYLVDAAEAASKAGFSDISTLWWWAMAYPITFFIDESIWRCSGFCGMQVITSARAFSSRKLFAYLTGHSSTYFNERFAGALTNKISNATQGTADLLASLFWDFIPITINFMWSFAIAAYADIRLGAILGIWVLVFLAINIYMVLRKQHYAYAVAEHGSILKGKMVDSASNISAVHQYGHHTHEWEYVDRFIENYRKADLKNWWLSEWILFVNGGLIAIFIAAMFAMSIQLLQIGVITIGTVVMIINVVINIMRALFFIGHKLTDFIDRHGQISEGLQELLQPHDIEDAPDAEIFVADQGAISFKDVHFGYGTKKVFDGLTLTVKPGEKIGLVGVSGAGKTTLVSLLLRQYDIHQGEVVIDGHEIKKVTRTSLLKNIAVVPQDVTLFHRTIRDNIRYGQLDATDAQVEHAAELAQAHDFISTLPGKYETFVGERGVKLSGGQRQRIAIARALLKNSRILVLDEATSSLDSESEGAIQQALTELMKGKTVLAIAHRLSTLQAMDRIIVLEKGRIAEDGTHQELIEKGGLYASLWQSQVQGFIQE